MIQIVLFRLLVFAGTHCLASNRDIFSPAKWNDLLLCVYFADVFLSPHSGYVCSACGLLSLGSDHVHLLEIE